MAIKSFNIDAGTYKQFSEYCKGNGISMSKQIEFFMKSVIEEDPKAKKEYLAKLDRIRKGRFVRVDNFAGRYGV